jgi:hypothetical protein
MSTPLLATKAALANISGKIEDSSGRKLEKIKTIQKDDLFIIVMDKLKYVGVVYVPPSNKTRDLESYVLVNGAKHSDGGQEHTDYLIGEDGVRLFAHEHLGWSGDEKTLKLLEEAAGLGAGRRRSRGGAGFSSTGEENKEKPAMTPVLATKAAMANISGKIEDSNGKKLEKIKAVQKDDLFVIVLDKLKYVGVVYVPPSVKTRNLETYVLVNGTKHADGGQENADYLVGEDGLRLFAHEHLGWGGDEKTLKLLEEAAGLGAGRRRSRGGAGFSSTGEEKKEEPALKKAKVPTKASTPPRKVNTKSQGAKVIDITKAMSPVLKKKVASRAEFMTYHDLAPISSTKSAPKTPPSQKKAPRVKVGQALSIDGGVFECHTFTLVLPGGAAKCTQQVTEGVVTYCVSTCDEEGIEVVWEVDGNKQTLLFSANDHFFIPFPNVYSITNVGKNEAFLSCQLVMNKCGETVEERLGITDRAMWKYHFDDK